MKCCIPEISWHNRDPVLSIDLQSKSPDGLIRLATAGTDTHVLMWSVSVGDNGAGMVEFLSDLARHQRAVNTVRFSPNGEILASGDDEALIILWNLKPKSDIPDIFANSAEIDNKENWNVWKVLRGHVEDVYDLCWSPDNTQLLSGSVDNTAILWDVPKGKANVIFSEHKGFVQGVAWDPKNQFVATLSSDRNCRVYSLKTKKVVQKMHQAQLKVGEDEEKPYKLFHDDTLKTFCRRLSFSPDGLVLFTPCGLLELNEPSPSEAENTESVPVLKKENKKMNATYAFTRNQHFAKPVVYYPSADRYSVAVRCCPVLFELRSEQPSMYDIPYRMVFAVATQNSLLLYDTQQAAPFARIARIHYTRLTDLSWSSDGRIIVVSSTDGYCSIVTFAEGELGTPYQPAQCEETEESPGLPSSFKTLLQGEIFEENVQPADGNNTSGISEDFHLAYEDTVMSLDSPNQKTPVGQTNAALLSPKNVRSPRRVQLITLSSPKQAKN